MTDMQPQLPHKITLNERKSLTVTGVLDVISFDEETVVLKTCMGILVVQGEDMQLKNLSAEGGQAAVEGKISSLLYPQNRPGGRRRRPQG